MSELLLFPLGQYLGAVHPGQGLPVRHHQVRIGSDVHPLDDGSELDVWALAHGHPAVVGLRPATRGLLEALAAEVGLRSAERVVDQLLDRGLLVQVEPGSAAAETFARGHRWYSLLTGLGESSPSRAGIGLLGAPPVRDLPAAVFEYWTWAHLFPDLHSAAAGLAEMAAGTPGEPAVATDADEVLQDLLGSLHELLCVNGGFLDVAGAAR